MFRVIGVRSESDGFRGEGRRAKWAGLQRLRIRSTAKEKEEGEQQQQTTSHAPPVQSVTENCGRISRKYPFEALRNRGGSGERPIRDPKSPADRVPIETAASGRFNLANSVPGVVRVGLPASQPGRVGAIAHVVGRKLPSFSAYTLLACSLPSYVRRDKAAREGRLCNVTRHSTSPLGKSSV